MSGKWVRSRLGTVAPLANNRISSRTLTAANYVSTDSLLPEKHGRIPFSSLPASVVNVPEYVVGDVLIGNIRPYLKKIWQADVTGGASSDVLIFHPGEYFNANYLYHWLSRDEFFDFMMKFSKGSKMPRGDKSSIAKSIISYPSSPSVQRHIAEILSTCDEVIEKSERAKEKLRRIKDGLLADLMTRGIGNDGKIRPRPAKAPHLYKQSELGLIPKEWDVKRLGDVWARFATGPFGTALHSSDYVRGGTPVVNPMHIIDGKILPSDEVRVNGQTLSRLNSYRLKKGDIVLGRRGELGRAALVTDVEDGWLCGTGSFAITLSDFVLPNYVAIYIRTPNCVSAMSDRAIGTTIQNLNQSIVAGIRIPIPKFKEQRLIADRLAAVDERIDSEENAIAKYRKIKAGLMHRLLTPPSGAEIIDLTEGAT